MEKMFEYLDTLEEWYNNSFMTLQDYLKIKSAIVDFYRNKNQENSTNDDLPF